MWYRLAEQGLYDPKTSTGKSLKNILENIISNSYENDQLNLETLNRNLANSELSDYISKFVPEYGSSFYARYDLDTKIMYLKLSSKKEALISFAKHELIHGADPRLKQVGPGKRFKTVDEMSSHYQNQWKKSGRFRYYDPLEVTAWRQQLEDAFSAKNLKAIYDNFYINVPDGEDLFKKEFKQFIYSLRTFSVSYDNAIKEIDRKIDENPNLKESEINEEIFDKYKLNLKSIQRWTKMVKQTSGLPLLETIYGIKDPRFFLNLNKYLSNQYLYLDYIFKNLPIPIDPLKNKTNISQRSKQELNSEIIQKLTVDSPEIKKPVTPQVDTALQKALPIIINTFNKLNEAIQKISNTRTGKVLRVGLIAKDVVFIITSSNKILNDIENERELQYKDIYDLGLSIVSLLSDPDTTAIVSKVYPPAAILLRNPEVVKWMTIINVSANTLQALVQASDYLGAKAGTTNPNVSQLSGILNNPGSLQQLSMTASQLKDQYGELYNALIDIEKGMKSNDSFNKHISSEDPLLEYKKVLLNRFLQNRNILKQKQKSSKTETYPSANSSYAISSYKKTRDQQNKMNVPVYNNRLRTMEQI